MSQPAPDSWSLDLPDEVATARLATRLASHACQGDVIALVGGLGAGKTSLAREFLRARAGDPRLEVPSPTFTLVQPYDLPGGAVWHFDLYRLKRPEEAWELGIEEAFGHVIALIEWPENLGELLPAERLTVELAPGRSPASRYAMLRASPSWIGRLASLAADG